MGHVESLQAMLERRLISSLVAALNAATTEEVRQRRLIALRDLVRHTDRSLDARLIDATTQSFLQRSGLWIWSDNDAEPDCQAADLTGSQRTRGELCEATGGGLRMLR